MTKENSRPLNPGVVIPKPDTSAAVSTSTATPATSQTLSATTAADTARRRGPVRASGSDLDSGATHQAASTSRPIETLAARSCTARAAGSP